MAFVDVAGPIIVVVGTSILGFVAVAVDHRNRRSTYVLTMSFIALALASTWVASRASIQLKGIFEFLGPFDLGLGFSFILQQLKRRLGYR